MFMRAVLSLDRSVLRERRVHKGRTSEGEGDERGGAL